jgi:hypothetical protein
MLRFEKDANLFTVEKTHANLKNQMKGKNYNQKILKIFPFPKIKGTNTLPTPR